MATNEEQRRAIGTNNAAQRRAIGTNNEAQRRAIQTVNTAERRGASIQSDLNSLAYPEKKTTTLTPVEPRGALPATRGSAPYVPKTAATGGGIASPVTETPNTREHYEPQAVWSSDGLVALMLGQIKTLHMTDANAAEVVFEFQNVLPE